MAEQIATAEPEVLFDVRGPVAVITLNRPERGNSLTPRMRTLITEAWCRVRDDNAIRVAIVTGSGDRHFCTGIDVAEVAASGQPLSGDGRADQEIVWSPFAHGVWKPVICALNGLVASGGLHFVADADIVIANRLAAIMDTHTSVGMVGGVELVGLSHRMPLGSALRMTLMGRTYRMSAERAHTLGLIDELVDDDVVEAAHELAMRISTNSPRALELSKQAIWESVGRRREDAAEYAWALSRTHRHHPDLVEGARAFVEGRDPTWT